jgi:hypothetical protein
MNEPAIPTEKEINVFNSLDERAAIKNFLGKNLEQAERLFRENSTYYQEDLMWMGPVAFHYYVHALIKYICSESSNLDSDIINCFADILGFRIEYQPAELAPVADSLAVVCNYIIKNYEKFDLKEEIYGDLRPRFDAYHKIFLKMLPQVP